MEKIPDSQAPRKAVIGGFKLSAPHNGVRCTGFNNVKTVNAPLKRIESSGGRVDFKFKIAGNSETGKPVKNAQLHKIIIGRQQLKIGVFG
jgi:hypothetical protein